MTMLNIFVVFFVCVSLVEFSFAQPQVVHPQTHQHVVTHKHVIPPPNTVPNLITVSPPTGSKVSNKPVELAQPGTAHKPVIHHPHPPKVVEGSNGITNHGQFRDPKASPTLPTPVVAAAAAADSSPQPSVNRFPSLFRTQQIPIFTRPYEPLYTDWLSTRYNAGCLTDRSRSDNHAVIPWIRNFDILVIKCAINWHTGASVGWGPACAYSFNPGDKMQTGNHLIERILIQGDPSEGDLFVKHFMPLYEAEYQKSGKQILIYVGGSDNIVQHHPGKYLASPAVKRLVMEQSYSEMFTNHSKVVLMPLGLCVRETTGQNGIDLKNSIAYSESIHDVPKERNPKLQWADKEYLMNNPRRSLRIRSDARQLSDAGAAVATTATVSAVNTSTVTTSSISSVRSTIAPNTPFTPTELQTKTWEQRKDRVFFCFQHKGENYVSRYRALMHIIDHCDFCDICKGQISHSEMWNEYANYKYVYSPLGNGQDCFRSWEIMVMGAIPIMPYFPGANAYTQGGLDVITFKNITEINRANLTAWNAHYKHSLDKTKLSMKYWEDFVFGGF